MAARLEPVSARPREIVDLRAVTVGEMDALLQEETIAWQQELQWDFTKSADLVRRFVSLRALHGAALIEESEVAGYAYYVIEEQKAIIGDLYIKAAQRTVERENALLDWVLARISGNPVISRVEAQLMMLRFEPGRRMPLSHSMSSYERNFMRVELPGLVLPEAKLGRPAYFERWSEGYQESAAHLIATAYAEHLDSRINDQYQTVTGARRFLHNIVQYPGCGVFYRPASHVAFDISSQLTGISLASIVGPASGHITQICVAPEARGSGIGYELLRRSLKSLGEAGCGSASLTVTGANRRAIELYERVGFTTVKRFSAFTWEGLQPRRGNAATGL